MRRSFFIVATLLLGGCAASSDRVSQPAGPPVATSTSTSTSIATATSASSPPAPAKTAAPVDAPARTPLLATRVKLTKTLRFLQGSRRVALTGAGGWFGIDREGFATDPALAKRIEALRSGDDDFDLFLGQELVVSKGNEKTGKHARIGARVGAKEQKVAVAGKLMRLATVGDDREAWVTMTTSGNRLHVIGANGSAKALSIPRAAGPKVEGLSELGAAACSVPMVHQLDMTNDGFAALVLECHREAPLHIARYRGPDLTLTEEQHPSPGFEGTTFVVHPDGRVAVLGLAIGRLHVARASDGSAWSVTKTDVKAEHILSAVMADDGAIWALTMRRDDGGDVWELTRDGALVPLSSESGAPAKIRELGVDRNAGVIARGESSDGEWLFLERPLAKASPTLP